MNNPKRVGLVVAALLAMLNLTTELRADPPGGTAGWTLTFSDDFNSIDTTAWITQATYTDGSGNLQPTPNYVPGGDTPVCYYVPSNVTASGGYANLTTVSGNNLPSGGSYGTLPYSSAWMATRNFQQLYGYFECRMKPAITSGIDAGFWMLNRNAWPPEIDIAECPSGSAVNIWGMASPGRGQGVNQALHAAGFDDGILDTSSISFGSDYHVYGCNWQPGRIDFYLDGVLTKTITSGVPTVPMYIILSNEVEYGDESWFGYLVNGSFPATTSVDYVKVWSGSGSTVPNGTYKLINRYSGQALSIDGGSPLTNGDNVLQWTYSSSGMQQWNVTNIGGSTYTLSCSYSGKFLSIDGSNPTANGDNVLQWDWSTTSSTMQEWQLVPTDSGYFQLVNVSSGKDLSIDGSNPTTNGDNVLQWDWLSSTMQQWSFQAP